MNTGEPAAHRQLRFGPLAVFALWSFYGALMLVQWHLLRFPDARAPWKPWGAAVLWMGTAWTWALLTPLIARVARHARSHWPLPGLPAHVFAIATIHAILYLPSALGWYFITYAWAPFGTEYARGLIQTTLLYSITAIATLALDHARLARERAARATQLEADLARSRLDTLRRQLQPHFLFNTLNTISALIDSDPRRAGAMVAQLGELLRRSLDEHEQPLIPLSAELEFVRLYAEIEQVRFESWLEVTEDIDSAALDAWVPPMVLQPLVENAIRHGIAPTSRKGTVLIRARVSGERVRLEVTDDGTGLPGAGPVRQGVGLGATRERLHHLFSGDARLDLSHRDGATTATVDLPLIRHVV